MKKRLRKKQYLKEFQQLGFRFRFDFVQPTTEKQEWDFLWALISYEDSNELSIGGGSNSFYALSAIERKSLTPAQRSSLIEWLEKRPDIINLNAEPLSDAWYPPKHGQ